MGNQIKTVKELPNLSHYSYDEGLEMTFFIKNNFLIDLEEYRHSNGSEVQFPLNRIQWMIIQTSFYLAHQLNQKNKQHNFDAETVFSFTLDQFAKIWGLDNIKDLKESGVIYNDIKRGLTKLRDIKLKYPELSGDRIVESGYFAYINYGKSEFRFGFPKPMIEYIKELGKYTWYYFENMINLQDNVQASILYEYLTKNKYLKTKDPDGVYTVNIKMDTLKKVLSPNTYAKTAEFRRNVLEPAIKYINSHTTMVIPETEALKIGRSIDEIKFFVKLDSKDYKFRAAIESANMDKPFMNVMQAAKFALALTKNVTFCDLHKLVAEDEEDLFLRLQGELSDNLKVIEYYTFLKDEGFVNSTLDFTVKSLTEDTKAS